MSRHYKILPAVKQSDVRSVDRDLGEFSSAVNDKTSTLRHLRDIHREHGFDKRWITYEVGHEPVVRRPRGCYAGSLIGSSAALCAE
jgi:hypothetical protein